MQTLISLIGISMAASGIPQILRLMSRKSSQDVSLTMWLILFHGQFWFTYYGFIESDMPVFITNLTCFIVTSILIYLTLLYRGYIVLFISRFLSVWYKLQYLSYKIFI